jgi:hypothetical protein
MDSFTVPEGKIAQFSIEESKYIELPIKVSPARPSIPEKSDEEFSKENVLDIVPYSDYYPVDVLHQIKNKEYRGTTISQCCITPIQYNYEKGIARLYSKIAYKVRFLHDNNSGKKSVMKISSDDYFLRNTTIMPKPVSEKSMAKTYSNDEVTKDYLIITIPNYLDAVNRFAEWKRHLGFNVIISTQNSWTSADVLAKVSNYNNLSYLLIVGSHSQIQGKRINPGQTPELYSDFYYGCTGGYGNMNQDISVGRLPVTSLEEADSCVNKIIAYEKNPTTDVDFYESGVNCANFMALPDSSESQRYTQTAERIREYLKAKGDTIKRVYYTNPSAYPYYWTKNAYYYGTGDTIPADLRKTSFMWDGSATDIRNGINNGAFYVLYRGHGYVNEWACPNFKLSDIGQLNNYDKYPVVFSICCESGRYSNFGTRCLADKFLTKSNGGAVAVFASIHDNNTGPNDVLAEGMFQAIWPNPGLLQSFGMSNYSGQSSQPVYELGAILKQGISRVDEFYVDYDPQTQIQYNDCKDAREYYHCFGDPSMEIRTAAPSSFTNVSIIRESDKITVNLGGNTGRIVFYNKTTNAVTAYQGSSAVFNCDGTSTIVCIYAHNKIPYINEPTEYDIQNQTITGNNTYSADKVKIGSNVTTSIPIGPVVFNSGTTNINGVTVEFHGETTVNSGAVLNVNN